MEYFFVTVASMGLYSLLWVRDKKITQSHLFSTTILETARVGISVVDEQGVLQNVNHTYAEMFKYEKADLIGKPFTRLLDEKDRELAMHVFRDVLRGARDFPREWVLRNKKGDNVHVVSDINIIESNGKPLVITSLTDISEQKKVQKELNSSLKEKEVLISEIHHRVKNNLSLITSLMHLQTFNSDNEIVNGKLCECVSRIHTVAAIHELLYQSGSFSKLQLDQSLSDLLRMITDTYGVKLQLELKMPLHKINLNINQAIPYLLIVNEVLLQIIDQQKEFISEHSLQLEMMELENKIYFKIKNDEKSTPLPFQSMNTFKMDKLGSILINTLAKQLEARIDCSGEDKNTIFALNFTKAEHKGIGNSYLA